MLSTEEPDASVWWLNATTRALSERGSRASVSSKIAPVINMPGARTSGSGAALRDDEFALGARKRSGANGPGCVPKERVDNCVVVALIMVQRGAVMSVSTVGPKKAAG